MAIKKISANLLGNNAVTAASIAGGAISAADIADNSITAAKISTSTFAIDSLTVNTSDLVVDTANNRVGIGTAVPSYKLSLQDNNTSAYPLVLENGNIGTPGVHTGIRFGYSGNSYQKGAIIFEGQDASARGKMYFAMEGTADNSNADETDAKMTIDYSGNIGIGETVPVAKLHIQGSGTSGQVTSSFLLENSSSGTAGLDIIGAAGSSRLRFLYGAGPSTGTNTLTEALNIILEGSNAGNVGIGTDSSTSKLTLLNNTPDGTTDIRQYATFGPTASWLDSDTVGWAGAGIGEVQIHNGTASRPPVLSLGGSLAAGELLGAVNFFRSSNTDTYRQRAYIASGLTSSGTADQHGADLRFATANDGATSPGLRMQINGSQTEVSFLRANSWHNDALNTVGGPAMEIGYSGSLAWVHGYNRNAGQYVEVAYDGLAHRWYTSGGTPNMFLTANGQLLCNFQTPASTSNFILGVDGSIGLGGDDFIAAGAGYGPSNSSAGAGTIKLYDTGTGNMNFNQTYTHARYYFYHGGNEVFRIEDGGHSGVYGYSFHYTTTYGSVGVGALNGGYHHTMVQSGPSTFYWNNRCEASGGFHTYSDERLKENVTTISGALDKVALMNGVTFNWIDAENRGGGDTGKQFGVIAQNMLEVDPELPSLNPDPLATQEDIDNEELETDYYTMDYSRITPFLIEAVKELKTKLEAAEARITELEA